MCSLSYEEQSPSKPLCLPPSPPIVALLNHNQIVRALKVVERDVVASTIELLKFEPPKFLTKKFAIVAKGIA